MLDDLDLQIDDKSLYYDFGAYLLDGSYESLLCFPALKSVDSNDWQEEDGVEVDLSTPVLDKREVQLKFAIRGLFSRFVDLINLLSDGAYHSFFPNALEQEYKLRLVSTPSLDNIRDFGVITLKFADDFPLYNYNYRSPISTLPRNGKITLDDVPFSDYGIRITDDPYSDFAKPSDVKENLLRNLGTLSGVIYDDKYVTYKSKDVRLSCFMTAASDSTLLRNLNALLYALTQPEERVLYIDSLGKEFPCYYKSCSVKRYLPRKHCIQFTLTMTLTRDFRITDSDVLLAAENGAIIITEDGYAIDLLQSLTA